MKTKFLGYAALIGVVFSCSSDDDNSSTTVSYAGTYAMTAFNVSVPQDLNADGIASVNQMNETNCFNGNTLILNENNTFTMTEKGIDIVTDGVNETLDCYDDGTYTGTWSLVGNSIKLDGEFGIELFKFADNKLTQSIENGEVVANLPNGGVAYVTANIDVVFTKQ